MPTFSFSKTNRIIQVDLPDTEVTIQQLINAVRNWEDELANIETAKIADASGKEDLGGGLQVGITLKLLNWKVKFADRSGPDYIDCGIDGGNLVAVNGAGQSMNPIAPSAYATVTVVKAVSAALLAEWTQAEKDALPGVIWDSSSRKLTSRDIESQLPEEHLPSEEQVEEGKGTGFETDRDSLIKIRELISKVAKAGFRV